MNRSPGKGQEQAIRSAQDIFEEFYACELVWSKVRVPNENELKNLLNRATNVKTETQILKSKRPNCKDLLENYEDEFSKYRVDIKVRLQINDQVLHQLAVLLFAREKIENLQRTIIALEDLRKKNWDLLTTPSIEYTDRVLSHLATLKHDVARVNPNLLTGLERVRGVLENNHSMLEELLEPTHEWSSAGIGNKKRCTKCSEEISLEGPKKPQTIYDEDEKDYPHYW